MSKWDSEWVEAERYTAAADGDLPPEEVYAVYVKDWEITGSSPEDVIQAVSEIMQHLAAAIGQIEMWAGLPPRGPLLVEWAASLGAE
jgi:hypothetical protein